MFLAISLLFSSLLLLQDFYLSHTWLGNDILEGLTYEPSGQEVVVVFWAKHIFHSRAELWEQTGKWLCMLLRDWSLITGREGATKREGDK